MECNTSCCARCGRKFKKDDLMYEQFERDEKNFAYWNGKYICDDCVDEMDQEELTREFCLTKNDIEDSLRNTLYTSYSTRKE